MGRRIGTALLAVILAGSSMPALAVHAETKTLELTLDSEGSCSGDGCIYYEEYVGDFCVKNDSVNIDCHVNGRQIEIEEADGRPLMEIVDDFLFVNGIYDDAVNEVSSMMIVSRLGQVNHANCKMDIMNYGTITGGSFAGQLSNMGTISGGEFCSSLNNGGSMSMDNEGTITGGTFTTDGGDICNLSSGLIQGGTFIGSEGTRICNAGTISGGIFQLNAINYVPSSGIPQDGTVTGGSFSSDILDELGTVQAVIDPNDGKGAETAVMVSTGTLPAALTRDGYDFAGWYADAACTAAVSAVRKPMKLYASWKLKEASGSAVVTCPEAGYGPDSYWNESTKSCVNPPQTQTEAAPVSASVKSAPSAAPQPASPTPTAAIQPAPTPTPTIAPKAEEKKDTDSEPKSESGNSALVTGIAAGTVIAAGTAYAVARAGGIGSAAAAAAGFIRKMLGR